MGQIYPGANFPASCFPYSHCYKKTVIQCPQTQVNDRGARTGYIQIWCLFVSITYHRNCSFFGTNSARKTFFVLQTLEVSIWPRNIFKRAM